MGLVGKGLAGRSTRPEAQGLGGFIDNVDRGKEYFVDQWDRAESVPGEAFEDVQPKGKGDRKPAAVPSPKKGRRQQKNAENAQACPDPGGPA